jgi:endoglucanase
MDAAFLSTAAGGVARAVCTVVVMVAFSGWEWGCAAVAQGAESIRPPLATRGAGVIDAAGEAVRLRGVTWFGMETEMHVPHGLWVRDYRDVLAQIDAAGFNLIRLPYSVQALRSDEVRGVSFAEGINADLQGLGPIGVLDRIIAAAQDLGLLVLLDSHRLSDERIPELWYGDGFTEADWIDTWTMLARRYRDTPCVIGADVKNEPHGAASWGTGDETTDFRLAAERCGDAIHEIAPHWLIVVEGVEKNVPGQQLSGHWWGGNLEGVRAAPVRLRVPNRVVYSPHEYGHGVGAASWLQGKDFASHLPARWEIAFHFIASEGIAPILVGEFGGRATDPESPEGGWQRAFVSFIERHDLGFCYWCWNPNSVDTGGLVKDDWLTPEQHKLDLLRPLLRPHASPPSPSASNAD